MVEIQASEDFTMLYDASADIWYVRAMSKLLMKDNAPSFVLTYIYTHIKRNEVLEVCTRAFTDLQFGLASFKGPVVAHEEYKRMMLFSSQYWGAHQRMMRHL